MQVLPSELIRTSQTTILEPQAGTIAKVRLGQKAFRDGAEILARLPEEFLGRSYILSDKAATAAICRRAGYVYAITAASSSQVEQLLDLGFRRVDIAAFPIFADSGAEAVALQRHVGEGETLAFGSWVLLIFGPEERGGVPNSKMRSVEPPVFLPDGTEFKTWETPAHHTRTLYVSQAHPRAADTNVGTADEPFKTIGRAALVLEPGERVVVGAGIYRECVRPARGGTDPEHMITYEAEPGASVVISGAEILDNQWIPSAPYVQDMETPIAPTVDRLWMMALPPGLFQGYNPFLTANYRQLMTYWKLPELFKNPRAQAFFRVAGLLFQDGRRLEQVDFHTELYTREGAFWVEVDGLTLHVSPFSGTDPNQAVWEVTAREQIFAPRERHLGYVKVAGFTMEYAANVFPFPQRGALSTSMGHHWIIEDNTVRWANSIGIDIGNQGYPPINRPEILGYHIVRGNTLEDIGITGLTGPGPFDSLIEDNVFRRNAWHDVEFMAESAAIKTHQNQNVLMRRNLIFDTLHGTGIYLDYQNSNTRICQNVILNTGTENGPGPGEGGIYIEHALEPVMVDHNFVWGSTRTNGIYSYQTTKLTVAYNMVGNCAAAGIWILDMLGRGGRSGGNRILNNIVVNNGWSLGLYARNNRSDHNVIGDAGQDRPFHLGLAAANYGGFPPPRKGTVQARAFDLAAWRGQGFDGQSVAAELAAEFNPDTLELVWSAGAIQCEAEPIDGLTADFWGRPTTGQAMPGPFGRLPGAIARFVVDPRPHADAVEADPTEMAP